MPTKSGTSWSGVASLVAFCAACVAQGSDRTVPGNLLHNPDFGEASVSRLPTGWEAWSPRPDLAPRIAVLRPAGKGQASAVRLASTGHKTFGGLLQTVNGVAGNQWYELRYRYRAEGIECPHDAVTVCLAWLDADGQLIEKQFVFEEEPGEGDWVLVVGKRQAPERARQARVELLLRGASGGSVSFGQASLAATTPPAPRVARLATVCFVPSGHTPDENRRLWAEQCEAAGQQGADLVCLSEGIAMVGTGLSSYDSRETVPGPTTRVLGEVARRHRMYIVAGVYEWAEGALWNTAVLIGRDGELVGRYRKTHLPEAEYVWGITPGTEYPVFETDLGKIGLEICYDTFFPECARSLAVKGAEIICLPIWGDGREENTCWDVVSRARAIDNAVYFVASIYSPKRSLIIDPWGHVLADTAGEEGVRVVEVDLNKRSLTPWLSVGGDGEWRTLWQKERRPSTYQGLAR
ncbi:MAG TPA: carbon-nitrogen hydrolase family protein [Armatimonadota bacterium]|nr:carbon-nitrogen hydrolase family protein [Armatimonadota bacterium]HQK92173.1 carbon-nitrogen hydrolase family protein [Armatimonadota bacterium]